MINHIRVGKFNKIETWQSFMMHGELAESLDPVIRDSWVRCMQDYKIDPVTVKEHDILRTIEFKERQERRRRLLRAAETVMKRLYKALEQDGCMVLLADEDGYILKNFINPGFQEISNRVKLYEGANWHERVKGTNAIGTSLAEAKAVQVFAFEHYLRDNHLLACAAVPVTDALGRIIGTLDVTTQDNRSFAHVLALVELAVKTVEAELLSLHLGEQLKLTKAQYNCVLELMKEGTLVVDMSGNIREINPPAERILGLKPGQAIGLNLTDVFNLNHMWVLESSANTNSVTVSGKFSSTLIDARSKSFGSDGDLNNGIVLNLAQVPEINLGNCRQRQNVQGGNVLRYTFSQIIGTSTYLQQVVTICKKVAKNNSTILLSGETGTGKEMLAQAIHQDSPRAAGPFVAVNCAAIPSELVESELFGYEEGAFTGAKKGGGPGKFELASGGTVFLDEIGDMSLKAQQSLLRVLQEKQFYRVGGSRPIWTDVRIIAATHRDLLELVNAGSFRQDLYYRLNVVNVNIPPLRSRREDIDLLVECFMNKYKDQMNRPELKISVEVLNMLKNYSWPGNIRELENIIEGLVNIVDGDVIKPEDLPQSVSETMSLITGTKPVTLKDIEKQAIVEAITECNGVLSDVADRLQIGRSTLYRKLKEYEIVVIA